MTMRDPITPADAVTAVIVALGLVVALYIGLCQSSPWP